MGRKKIAIKLIKDDRNRQITFVKRKAGLMKKAYELSVLCGVEVGIIMYGDGNQLYQYASSSIESILTKYVDIESRPIENRTNEDFEKNDESEEEHQDAKKTTSSKTNSTTTTPPQVVEQIDVNALQNVTNIYQKLGEALAKTVKVVGISI